MKTNVPLKDFKTKSYNFKSEEKYQTKKSA